MPVIFMERFVPNARHVEVQIFGDGGGRVIALGERDCSLQRRNQKVIEETPAPGLSERHAAQWLRAPSGSASAVGYRSAGTVEFLFDANTDEFFFLEVNTRLQVEHGITEKVTGIDLVEWMVRCARWRLRLSGRLVRIVEQPPPAKAARSKRAFMRRIPLQANRPSSGTITELDSRDVRVDTWIATGTEVTHLLRSAAREADRKGTPTAPRRWPHCSRRSRHSRLAGIETNLDWLRQIVAQRDVREGRVSTSALASVPYRLALCGSVTGGLPRPCRIFPAGSVTGMSGPPSGPMDNLAFRLGNRLLGNREGAAGLEVTAVGPTLRFDYAGDDLPGGGRLRAPLMDGLAVPSTHHRGCRGTDTQTRPRKRARAAIIRPVSGRTRCAPVSAEPCDLHARALRRACRTQRGCRRCAALWLPDSASRRRAAAAASCVRPLPASGDFACLYGPHGAPDFFTGEDIEIVLAATWKVHYNSNRTGVRLIGPKPRWARRDGGEAGLHPSNIHDNAYAIGAIDFTGDMPIILGPDGPSLGGFVCPFVVIQADLWKFGQLAPGR